MNMSSRFASTASLCILGASLAAVAGDGPHCDHNKTASLDVEGNAVGQISASAHAAGAQKRFEMMDTNKDGKVTAAEIGATTGAESIAWSKDQMSAPDKIRKLDSNHDGALTNAEYADGSQKIFGTLDADSDGYLTAAEMGSN